jgi:hypothetical protein
VAAPSNSETTLPAADVLFEGIAQENPMSRNFLPAAGSHIVVVLMAVAEAAVHFNGVRRTSAVPALLTAMI